MIDPEKYHQLKQKMLKEPLNLNAGRNALEKDINTLLMAPINDGVKAIALFELLQRAITQAGYRPSQTTREENRLSLENAQTFITDILGENRMEQAFFHIKIDQPEGRPLQWFERFFNVSWAFFMDTVSVRSEKNTTGQKIIQVYEGEEVGEQTLAS